MTWRLHNTNPKPRLVISMNSPRVIFSFLFLLLVSCASQNGHLAVPLYGEFCGPGHPNLDHIPLDQQSAAFEDLEPKDDIDRACKVHDECFAAKGYFDPDCDRSMVSTLKELNLEEIECRHVAADIIGVFHLTPIVDNKPTNVISRMMERLLGSADAGARLALRPVTWFFGYPEEDQLCNTINQNS